MDSSSSLINDVKVVYCGYEELSKTLKGLSRDAWEILSVQRIYPQVGNASWVIVAVVYHGQ